MHLNFFKSFKSYSTKIMPCLLTYRTTDDKENHGKNPNKNDNGKYFAGGRGRNEVLYYCSKVHHVVRDIDMGENVRAKARATWEKGQEICVAGPTRGDAS